MFPSGSGPPFLHPPISHLPVDNRRVAERAAVSRQPARIPPLHAGKSQDHGRRACPPWLRVSLRLERPGRTALYHRWMGMGIGLRMKKRLRQGGDGPFGFGVVGRDEWVRQDGGGGNRNCDLTPPPLRNSSPLHRVARGTAESEQQRKRRPYFFFFSSPGIDSPRAASMRSGLVMSAGSSTLTLSLAREESCSRYFWLS